MCGDPLDIIDKLYEIIKGNYDKVLVSDKTWKISFRAAGKYIETEIPQEEEKG